jgi:hypothetical protein
MAKPGDERRRSVEVIKTYEELDSHLAAFRDGHYPLMVLIGSWGIGKSELVKASLGEHGCWIEGMATAFGIYSLFYKYQNQPIVLDDIDGLYTDKHAISLLKAICRTQREKRVAWNARNGFLEREGLPKDFVTTSPVMIICNEWKALNRNVAALEDRAEVFSFEPGPKEIHARAGTWFHDKEIYDWFGEHLHRIEAHSFRSYVKAANRKAAGNPWKRIAKATTGPAVRENLVRELLADVSFAGNEERARAFRRRGGGSRGTFFAHRRKILGLDDPAPEPEVVAKRGPGRPRKMV